MYATRYLCFARRSVSIVRYDALEAYKKAFGHLNVPQNFVFSNDDKWPDKLKGFTLGKHVCWLRVDANHLRQPEEVIEKLNKIGFVFSARKHHQETVFLAFHLFVQKYGHGKVPKDFIIGENDESWPVETRGFQLGWKLAKIRQGNYFAPMIERLREIGVEVDSVVESPDFEKYFEALKVYKKLNGSVKVPPKFIIPDDSNYTRESHGLKLGSWLRNIRLNHYFQEHRPRLEELGVDFNVVKVQRFSYELVVETIEAFKSLYGHMNVYPSFVVPIDDTRFPKAMWGVALGARIRKWAMWKRLKALGVTNKDPEPNDEVS